MERKIALLKVEIAELRAKQTDEAYVEALEAKVEIAYTQEFIESINKLL